MDINYSTLIRLPTREFDSSQVYYLAPKYPEDNITYYVDFSNIITSINSVSVDADGLEITNVLSDQKTNIVYFDISGGANNTSYIVNVTVSHANGNIKTKKFNLYISSDNQICSNPPMVLGPPGPAGAQGPIGPQGVQGPVGPVGPQGIQGPRGLTGATGPQGLQGETGSTGPQGPVGPIGPQGLQGETGSTGPQGPVGPIGPQGLQGLTGAQGPQGIKGDNGLQGLPGKTGPAGNSAYELAVLSGFKGTESDWLTSLKGQTGPQGIQGPQGLQGLQGPQGETGPQGPQGLQGKQGPAGIQGMQGETGPKGDTGDTGKSSYDLAVSNGFKGTESDWLISLRGPTGSQGIQGIQGPKGDTGAQGPSGLQGIQGLTGAQGPKGEAGTGLNYKGIWAAGVTYGEGDYVFFTASTNSSVKTMYVHANSSPFISTVEPDKDTSNWIELKSPSGASAYEIALENGYTASEVDWLNSLKGKDGAAGPKGDTGATGPQGPQGIQGIQGPAGATGDTGPQGNAGYSAYQIAVAAGYYGSESDWLTSLKGQTGPQGPQGIQGPAGAAGTSYTNDGSVNLNVKTIYSDTGAISSDGTGILTVKEPTDSPGSTSDKVPTTSWVDTNYARKRVKTKADITTNGQSTFTFPYYDKAEVDIFLNGNLLDPDNAYSLSNGTTITLYSTLAESLTTDDVLYFILN